MKFNTLFVLALSTQLSAFGQNEISKDLPPLEMLPKESGEVKQIYELPKTSDYSVYDATGNLISEGNAKYIDYTEYKVGTYFVRFDGKSESFKKME